MYRDLLEAVNMKETKNIAGKIQQLLRNLKRKYPKPVCPVYEEPVDALLFAFISEQSTEQQADAALKKINEHFIDLNDIRVSRPEEIVEGAGADAGFTIQAAVNLTAAMATIFEKYNMVTLTDIKKLGKKPIREIICQIPTVSPFVVDYCMLTAFGAHAVPLTAKMLDFLRTEKIAAPGADPQQLSQMLARHIPAKDAYTFYALLRRDAEMPAAKPKPEKDKKKKHK
jgi:endonuclease III